MYVCIDIDKDMDIDIHTYVCVFLAREILLENISSDNTGEAACQIKD